MTDETLRAATTNNEFLRALGELVIAGARLEQLDISPVEPAETDNRLLLWAQRANELLDERDRFVQAAAAAHDGATIIAGHGSRRIGHRRRRAVHRPPGDAHHAAPRCGPGDERAARRGIRVDRDRADADLEADAG